MSKNPGFNRPNRPHTTQTIPDAEKRVPIRFGDPNQLSSIYANQFAILSTGTEVTLVFYEATPPLVRPMTNKEKLAALSAITEIAARPVARIVVPLTLVPSIIRVLSRQPNIELSLTHTSVEASE